jgi:hypothetical protein
MEEALLICIIDTPFPAIYIKATALSAEIKRLSRGFPLTVPQEKADRNYDQEIRSVVRIC